jgi:N-acetylglucosaminyl-diphospho-decaprenol L-rhamnosyltransferase
VSAIVVSWKTPDLLSGCLQSLRRHAGEAGGMQVVVVDNGSDDGTAEMVTREWPDVRLIVNAENAGYTRANNQAIRLSVGEYLLLINADALLTPGCLERMLARMSDDPRAGAVGPRLIYGDGRWQRWTAGRAPGLGAALGHYFLLERLFPNSRACQGMFLGRDVCEAMLVDWVSSACMLVRRSAIDQVGLMDERFFVYMDDVDLCQRLRTGGWSVWYAPEAEAVHFMGQATKRQTGSVSPAALRSYNRYFAMNHGRVPTAILRLIQFVGHGSRASLYLGAAMTSRKGPRRVDLRRQARAHWVYLKAALGS